MVWWGGHLEEDEGHEQRRLGVVADGVDAAQHDGGAERGRGARADAVVPQPLPGVRLSLQPRPLHRHRAEVSHAYAVPSSTADGARGKSVGSSLRHTKQHRRQYTGAVRHIFATPGQAAHRGSSGRQLAP